MFNALVFLQVKLVPKSKLLGIDEAILLTGQTSRLSASQQRQSTERTIYYY